MCSECCAWMGNVKEKTNPIIAKAVKAFWKSVASSLPEVEHGTVCNVSGWYEIMEEEVAMWAVENLPLPKVRVTPTGRPSKRKPKREETWPIDGEDASWQPFKSQ